MGSIYWQTKSGIRDLRSLPKFAQVTIFSVLATVLLLPWEVTKLLIPLAKSEYVGTQEVSLLDASKLAIVFGLLALPWVVNKTKNQLYWKMAVVIWAIFAIGLLYSPDSSEARVELIRLSINLGIGGLALMTANLGWGPRILRAFRTGMVFVSAILLIQYLQGFYLWNNPLSASGRSNGPFADPNIAGRFVVVALVLEWFFMKSSEGVSSPKGLSIHRMRLFILFAGLIATGSRSNLAILLLVPLALFFDSLRKVRQKAFVMFLLLSIGLVCAAVLIPTVQERISSFSLGLDALGSRTSLLRAALEMWKDHPLLGVGLSGYDVSILGDYSQFQGYYGAEQTASHTSVATTLAELGILGMIAFGAIALLVRRSLLGYSKLTQLGSLGIAIGSIFLSSQSEGRFWSEPLLWILLGLLAGWPRFEIQQIQYEAEES
jgi:O-antigen ligase